MRSWAPALLAGHGASAAVLVLVTLGTALAGARLDARPGVADVVRAVVVVPWTWAGPWLGASTPAAPSLGVPLLVSSVIVGRRARRSR